MIKVAVCDDDRCFAQKLTALLNSYAAEHGEEFQITVFADAPSFLSSAVELYDAVFLDVCIGNDNGMDVAKTLRQRSPEGVLVFVSSYLEFATQGYQLEAMDYLLKNDLEQLFPLCIQRGLKKLKAPAKMFSFRTTSGVDAVCRLSLIHISPFAVYHSKGGAKMQSFGAQSRA